MKSALLPLIASTAFRWLLSLSLALTPLAGLFPKVARAQEATPVTATIQLLADIAFLLDRAYYPNVPRRGLTGVPTASELEAVRRRLANLRAEIQASFAARVAATSEEWAEGERLAELSAYFQAAKDFESIQLVLGQPTDPETWSSLYDLQFDIKDLAQIKFLLNASMISTHFAAIPNSMLDLGEIAAANSELTPALTHLERHGERWMLTFRFNPNFTELAEQIAMSRSPSIGSTLKLAMHWSGHRLYQSLAFQYMLLRQPLTALPEPPAYLRDAFQSFRTKKRELIEREQRELFAAQKPEVFKAFTDLLDSAYADGSGYAITEDLLRDYYALIGAHPNDDELRAELERAREFERQDAEAALLSLLNLVDLREPSAQVPFLLENSRRLALRSLLLIPMLGTGIEAQVRDLIESSVTGYATRVRASSTLVSSVEQVLKTQNLATVRTRGRHEFQKALTAAALKIKTWETDEVNAAYLLASKMQEIDALKPSRFVSTLVEGLSKQSDYRAAHLSYKQALLAYLQAFTLPAGTDTSLRQIFARRHDIRWNGAAIANEVPEKYLRALNENANGRTKDLQDLIRVGEMMKFDTFETLPADGKVTVDTLGLSSPNMLSQMPLLGGMFGSEKTAYLEEVRKDVLNNNPVLGPEDLWKTLAADPSDVGHYALVDRRLSALSSQVHENLGLLEQEWRHYAARDPGSLDAAGENLRTLVLRASQISVAINQFAGFQSYYEDVRLQLTLPSFWRAQWEGFSSWANTTILYMFGFLALNVVGSRVKGIGELTKAISEFMSRVVGPKVMGKINWFVWGLIGFSVSEAVAQGFVFESQRRDLLEKFFACGADAPCVALYSDVAQQTALMNIWRMQAVTTIVLTAVIFGAIYGIGRAYVGFTLGSARAITNPLTGPRGVLGLADDASLSARDLQTALNQRIRQAAQTYSDPVKREFAVLMTRDAYARIESAVLKESRRWAALDARYARELEQLGLSKSGWKNLGTLRQLREGLIERHRAGQISTANFNRLTGTLNAMMRELTPVYLEMESNAVLRKFMERVWNTQLSVAEIRGARSFFESRVMDDLATFAGKNLQRSGKSPARNLFLDRNLNRLRAEFERDPRALIVNPERLRELVLKAVGR